MAVEALEARMARLEGAYEQINARLGSLEQRVTSEFATLRAEMRAARNGLDLVLTSASSSLFSSDSSNHWA